jgi:hypothetical protein
LPRVRFFEKTIQQLAAGKFNSDPAKPQSASPRPIGNGWSDALCGFAGLTKMKKILNGF